MKGRTDWVPVNRVSKEEFEEMKTDNRWPNLVFPNKAILPTKDAKFESSKELEEIRDKAKKAGKAFKETFGEK